MKSNWRNLSRWPLIGIDVLALPAILFPFLILSLISTPARWASCIIGVWLIAAKVLNCRPARLITKLRVSKKKEATPAWRKHLITSMLLGSLISLNTVSFEVKADFRIVGVKEMVERQKQAFKDNKVKPIKLIKGLGRGVKLESLLSEALPFPWEPRYLADEVRDLQINWAAPNGITERELLVDIARRYGLAIQVSEPEYLYYIDWNVNDVCGKDLEHAVTDALKIDAINGAGDISAKKPVNTRKNKLLSTYYVC